MSNSEQEQSRWQRTRSMVKLYVIGLGLGPVCCLYGLIALLVGRTFLPGQVGGEHFIQGITGTLLALAYASGGLFLFLRLFLEKKVAGEHKQKLHFVQDALLIVIIVSLIYVLVNVGEVK